jgi:magnesium-transporting ATPase (P-type)
MNRSKGGLPSPEEGKAESWHSLAEEEIYSRLGTTLEGLSDEQNRKRLIKYGENVLPVRKPPTLLTIFLHQFKSPLIYVLLAAAVVALVLAEYTDAGFIFAVLILNAGLGTFQEWNAERSAAGLQKLLTPTARVRRSGVELTIPSRELVPGDAVLIGSGDRVPADLRLVQANNLTIDESFLTGESIAPRKGTNPLPEDAPIGDRRCMAFAGSMVMTGRGFGVVVTTGSQTQVGQIAYAVTFAEGAKPPLLIRMERFARQISIIVG